MRHYLVYFESDNTWDILPQKFIKNENEQKCKVSYTIDASKNKVGTYTGYIEYKGLEENCLKIAKELHPYHFNQTVQERA